MKTDMKKAGIPELNEAEALEVCKLMLQCELFHRSEKAGKGVLEISTPQNNVFVLGGWVLKFFDPKSLSPRFCEWSREYINFGVETDCYRVLYCTYEDRD